MSLLLLVSLVVLCTIDVSARAEEKHLRPRMKAPIFKANAVLDDEFIKVNLQDHIDARKWTVLLFYPFDYTFVCPTEIISFSQNNQNFKDINTQVLGISTDSHHTHLAWTRTPRENGGVGKLEIPLVADISKEISANYGVLVQEPEDEMYGAALRGLFIIDPTGTVRQMQINDDAVGRSVEETLRLVKGFQYADSHMGEACPASWTPGADTIKANPNDSKDYFKSHYSSS